MQRTPALDAHGRIIGSVLPTAAYEGYPNCLDGDQRSLETWIDATKVREVSAVDWHLTQEWQLEPRVIHDNMWFWFRKGTGVGFVSSRGDAFRIEPGGVMVVPPNTKHYIRRDAGIEMSLVTVHFSARVYGGLGLLELLRFPAWLPNGKCAPYRRVNQRILRETALMEPGWQIAVEGAVMEILLHTVRHYGSQFSTVVHADLPRIAPVLAMIDLKLEEPLRIGDMAALVHLSEAQFRKIFKRVTGLSPNRFVQRRRVQRACEPLLNHSLSVDEIARATGFVDTPFFYKVFKRWIGVTPRTYRVSGLV